MKQRIKHMSYVLLTVVLLPTPSAKPFIQTGDIYLPKAIIIGSHNTLSLE